MNVRKKAYILEVKQKVRHPRLSFLGWCRLASIRHAVLTEMLALLAATSCVKFSRNFIYNLICLSVM